MTFSRSTLYISTILISLFFFFLLFAQQNLPFIRVSPQAKVVQNISL